MIVALAIMTVCLFTILQCPCLYVGIVARQEATLSLGWSTILPASQSQQTI